MKTKLIALLFIGIILIIPSLPIVNAFNYANQLPSNTIFADDFEKGFNWRTRYVLGLNNSTDVIALNNTIAFDGNSSLGMYNPNNNENLETTKNLATTANRIGISVWFAFNYAMYHTIDGQAPEFVLRWWESTGFIHSALVEYRPGLGQWVVFGSRISATDTTDPFPFILYTYPGTNGNKNGNRAYNDLCSGVGVTCPYYQNAWTHLKYIIDKTTSRYISVCVESGCLNNATDIFANRGPDGPKSNYPGKQDISVGLRETNDATTVATNVLIDNVIVTNEDIPSACGTICLNLFNTAYLIAGMFSLLGAVTTFGITRRMFDPEKSNRGAFGHSLESTDEFMKGVVIVAVVVLVVVGIVLVFASFYGGSGG